MAQHRVQNPLRSAGGQVLFTDEASILSRWSEHFQSLFIADRVVRDPVVLCIPQQQFKSELDELPSMKEITKAIEHLRSSKVTGAHGIPPELWNIYIYIYIYVCVCVCVCVYLGWYLNIQI